MVWPTTGRKTLESEGATPTPDYSNDVHEQGAVECGGVEPDHVVPGC